jgi:hypothetical protein
VLWPGVLGLAWSVSIFDSELWWSMVDGAEGASLCALLLLFVGAHWGQPGLQYSMC